MGGTRNVAWPRDVAWPPPLAAAAPARQVQKDAQAARTQLQHALKTAKALSILQQFQAHTTLVRRHRLSAGVAQCTFRVIPLDKCSRPCCQATPGTFAGHLSHHPGAHQTCKRQGERWHGPDVISGASAVIAAWSLEGIVQGWLRRWHPRACLLRMTAVAAASHHAQAHMAAPALLYSDQGVPRMRPAPSRRTAGAARILGLAAA